MKLSKLTNPKLLVLLVLTISLLNFTSCAKDDEADDITKEIVYTYVGSFITTDFSSVTYKVAVSKVDNTTVKITPEDNHGDSFEVNISLGGNGAVIGDANQVVFANDGNGNMALSYKKDTQQFAGIKQ